MTNKKALLFSALWLLSSCAPIPHFDYRSPHVSGLLTKNSEPLAHTEIGINTSFRHSCSEYEETTMTDSSGAFSFKAKRNFYLNKFILGETTYKFELCVVDQSKTYFGYSIFRHMPKAITLECDINQESKDVDSLKSSSKKYSYNVCQAQYLK